MSFDWSTTTHKDMLEFSAAAYCPADHIFPDWTCNHCMGGFNVTTVIYNPSLNTFGYIGFDWENNRIVLAYRGTVPDSLTNWITDLEVSKQVPYEGVPNAAVHEGFYTAYEAVKDQMMNGLTTLTDTYPHVPIYITGHSLGAALSILAAVDIADNFPDNELYMYNYGDPRVGNQVFSNFFSTKVPNVWRVVNRDDPVPHLPFVWLNFYHVPTEVWYHSSQYKICNGGEDPSCSDSVPFAVDILEHINYMGVWMGFGKC